MKGVSQILPANVLIDIERIKKEAKKECWKDLKKNEPTEVQCDKCNNDCSEFWVCSITLGKLKKKWGIV